MVTWGPGPPDRQLVRTVRALLCGTDLQIVTYFGRSEKQLESNFVSFQSTLSWVLEEVL